MLNQLFLLQYYYFQFSVNTIPKKLLFAPKELNNYKVFWVLNLSTQIKIRFLISHKVLEQIKFLYLKTKLKTDFV